MPLNDKAIKLGGMLRSPFSCTLAYSIINEYTGDKFKEIYGMYKIDMLRRYNDFKSNKITRIIDTDDNNIRIDYE